MKVEVEYKVLRVLIVIVIVALTSIFTVKILGRGQIIHKFSFKNNIIIPKEQEFNYNILNILGDVRVEGKAVGNIAVINSDIYIDGEVHGNVINIFGKIHKGTKAEIFGEELEISKDKKNNIIQNKILDSGHILYIVFSILSCLSLYFIDTRFRIREANNFQKKLYKKLKFGYVIEILGGILLITLILALLGIQFAPAIALIPIILLGMFIMYLIGFVSLMIYIGMKINSNINIRIPYPLYISFFIIIYSFIRNIPYISEVVGFLVIMPISIGSVYVDYFHKCLKRMEHNGNEKNI